MNQPTNAPAPAAAVHAPNVTPAASTVTAIPGLVTQQIGSGDHAQNAIVYRTILWSFLAGGLLSAAAFGHAVMKSAPSPLSEVKEVWAIFAPLITLALGYLFGKGR